MARRRSKKQPPSELLLRVRALLQKHQININMIQDATQLPRKSLRSMLRGKSPLTGPLLEGIAGLLNMTTEELVTGEAAPPDPEPAGWRQTRLAKSPPPPPKRPDASWRDSTLKKSQGTPQATPPPPPRPRDAARIKALSEEVATLHETKARLESELQTLRDALNEAQQEANQQRGMADGLKRALELRNNSRAQDEGDMFALQVENQALRDALANAQGTRHQRGSSRAKHTRTLLLGGMLGMKMEQLLDVNDEEGSSTTSE